MREFVYKEIDGKKYEFHHLPIKAALSISLMLTKMLGLIASKSVNILRKDINIEDILDSEITVKDILKAVDLIAVGDVIEAFTDRLSETEINKIVDAILEHTCVQVENGFVAIQPEVHFQGSIDLLCMVVFKGLEVNFGSFLDRIKKKMAQKQAQEKELKQTSTKATKEESNG